ncbi:MAG: PhoD-like phosphatase N-terminal domain-containing protein, partial [Planctomycetota bacterium]|nr:PhoD-like phosphatase N-terminal domain-containing protein [Planctomycetota bacterium]
MRTPPRVLLAGPLAVLLAAAAIGADDVIPHRQDRAPNRPYSPQEAIERMKVPEGFSVELVASEPDIVNPLAMTFDERGRIWITESLEYPRKSAGPGRDRIQVLEDTDRDGRADRFTVFAEGFNIPSGVAVGHGGVWVVNAPDLLFLREEGGRETGREVVVSGFGRTDTHELPNSLTWGPDGWLYGLNGVFNRSHVVSGESEHRFTCALWRVHPKTREFQIVCEGTSNPWGLVWAADGSAIVSACHWANDHIFHFVETGTYQRQAGPYPPYTLKIGSVSDHSHQKTAYCGLAYFDSDAYPLPYRDRLYLGNVHGNCINVDVLGRDGSTYVSRSQPDLLTADDVWFMPVSQKVGPDGCLYILDWYDRYHCYQDANRDPEGVDRLRGRLYRVRYRDTPRAPRFDLARESDERLVERLASPNIYFRETAQRLLVERSHPALRRRLEQLVLDDAAPPKARRHALWSLVGAGPLRTDFHLRLLEHPDDVFRAWGVRAAGNSAAGNRGEVSGKIARKVAALARDPVPEVQLQVAIASRKVAGLDALEVLSDVLDGAGHDKLIPSIAWPNLHPLLDDEGERFVRRIERQTTPLPPALATLVPHALSRLLAEPRPDVRAARRLLEFLCRRDAALAKRCLAAVSAAITGRSAESLAAIRGEVAPLVERLRSDPEGPLFLGAQLLAARLALGTADAGSVRRRFLSSAAPEDERLEALETLVAFRDPALLEAVGRVLVSGPPGFLGRVLGALGSWDEPKLADVVLRRYPEMAPELQPLAVDLLMQRLRWMRKLVDAVRDGRLPRSTLDANHLRRILESNDRHAIWAVEGTWGRVRRVRDPDRERVVREMAELLRRTPGEPLAGEKVFRRLCAQCHAIHDEGQDVGPDLTTNGRASFDQLVSNVFDPSLVIGPGYEVTTVVTRSGRVLTGLVAEDSAARMVLKTPGGKRETVSRNRVKYTSVSQLSMMPEGIEKLVEPGDLADLFAFLSSDRHPRDPRARPIPGAPRASSVASGAPDGGTGGAPGGGHREDATAKTSAGPFLATGVRVGEVGPRRAIVWVRLTARPERHASGKKAAEAAGKKHVELAEGVRVSELEGSCPGAPGSARVLYSERRDLEDGRETPWRAARQGADFVVQLPLAGLSPGTTVHYRVESRSPAGDSGASFTGSFRTAEVEDSEAPVSFTVVTGMMYRDLDDERGFHIYDAMRRLEPSFLVATGDTVYYD